MARVLPGLEPGEALNAWAAVSFGGATVAGSRATYAVGSLRRRLQLYDVWAAQAQAAGFPTAGPDVVLGVTDTELIMWRTSFGLGRPVAIAGRVPLARIAQVSTVRMGLTVGLTVVTPNGTLVAFEALRGRRLRALGKAIAAGIGSAS